MAVGKPPRPTPWRLIDEYGVEIIRDADNRVVHNNAGYHSSRLDRVDADYIVAAVNAADRYELALYRIAGHGNITGEQARKIAIEALGIPTE